MNGSAAQVVEGTCWGHKFVYGRRENFRPLLEGSGPLRFSDINRFALLENRAIADDETGRKFPVRIKQGMIAGMIFDVDQTSKPPTMVMPTRRCHVLCLSNTGNAPSLFEKFDADTCLKIDVDLLVRFLRETIGRWDIEVVAENVVYFGVHDSPPESDPLRLVFYKDERFREEDEFRIAIFYPYDERTCLTQPDGRKVLVFEPTRDYTTIGFSEPDTIEVIEEAVLLDGTVVFSRNDAIPSEGEMRR